MSPAPTMQHLPQPRATRAAWLVMPPRAVRMPSAARMPSTSSGLVSSRTRITFSPFLAASTASTEVKTILPQAAPGPAGSPERNASAPFSAAGLMIGCSSSSSCAGCTRMTAVLLVDQPLVEHVHRHVQGGRAGPLAVAALEHVELAFLDRELDVLHVVVVRFELAADVVELLVQGRPLGLQRRQVLVLRVLGSFVQRIGRADAGHHVLALGVDEPLAVELVLAGGRVAREGHAGGRGVAQVAEDHALHVAGGAPIAGDALDLAIGNGPAAFPTLEHRADGAPKLLVGIVGELAAQDLHNLLLEIAAEPLEVGGGQVGVRSLPCSSCPTTWPWSSWPCA